LSHRHPIRRIALISPCAGNLGNAAILSSIIVNVRSRVPGVEIVAATLNPEDTKCRHQIAVFPITGTSHGVYQLALAAKYWAQPGTAPRRASYIKGKLKGIRWLRELVRTAVTIRLELAHILQAGRLVRTLDRVIVAGGGALDDFWGGPWGHPWTLFKFAVLSRLFRVPFIFVSVGFCSLDHRLSRWFAGCALRLAEYRSFRDSRSRAEVQAMFPRISSTVSPDLAYGYRFPELHPARKDLRRAGPVHLAVSPIAFCDPRAWPVKNQERYSRYIEQLARFVGMAVSDGHRLTLFATENPDTATIDDLLKILSARSLDTTKIEVIPGPPSQTTEVLLQRICDADVVIASRLHGVILSHLIGIPVAALSYDHKVDVHMDEIGQSRYCMSIDEFTAETLAERFAMLVDARAEESRRVDTMIKLYKEQAGAQFDLLFGACRSDNLQEINTCQFFAQVQQ
jgi:polysaccharide pyruvyl transferase WcaK-like protein